MNYRVGIFLLCCGIVAVACKTNKVSVNSSWRAVRASTSTSNSADKCFLTVHDKAGLSYIYNPQLFKGDGLAHLGKTRCWDFLVLHDGGLNEPIAPRLVIYSGDPMNPTAAAVFTASNNTAMKGQWVHVCAPIERCSGNQLPSNAQGDWTMKSGATANDWERLLQQVSGIRFVVDVTSAPTEVFGFDNIQIR